ncbi:hypothetical protein [uncultured Halomonas sp.]|uniref:hypothetical protein n=1 Tax=uncultured Halomonas sp. TaxID=173971 RepID=UPI0026387C89|nr:hypothetical protein [uncultured Halomonas sp.]
MDKETIKAFIAWLETATEQEIQERRQQALNAHLSTPEARADIKLALRLIDEELLSRLDLKAKSR